MSVFLIVFNPKQIAKPGSHIPLDLALDSIDDMYNGCKNKMEYKVKREYFLNEKNKDGNLTLAWTEAEKYYNKRWKGKNKKHPSSALGKEEIMAIYIYTLDKPKIYLDFNRAVRTQKSTYKTTFRYHALHFFLTEALEALNARKPEAERCLTGFRRVNDYFSQDVLNKEIRFGSFTSSSMGWYPDAGRFGGKTCFEILTCSGADISLYSKLGEAEREVLIPPHEVFKVTKIERRSEKKSLPCELVYKVKSTRKTLSRLNCALF
ncbi:ecto-ADP-ribosyltransferase 5-like [Aulostomus maculatus]